MDKWEYRVEVSECLLESTLNNIGSMGWELVTVFLYRDTSVVEMPKFQYIFKRPRKITP